MLRDVLTSHVFGAGAVMDAFGIAYQIPNLFRRLFGEGALTAAFLPAFVSRLEKGKSDEAFSLLNRLMTRLLVLLAVIVVVGEGVTLLTPLVWPDPKSLWIARLTRIMLPYLVFICGAALLGAALNSLHRFFAPAFSPVLINIVWIAAIVAFRDIEWVA